ncbi:hypothetical protein BGX21_008700 [Mortierella sp. AD011]|nr:hypothetical protein BGX21_008700 [Mortierella sp. AD011]
MSLLACANGYPASIPHGLARSFEGLDLIPVYNPLLGALGFGQFVIHQLTESTQIVLYQIGKVKDQERPGKDDNSDDSNDTNLDVNALSSLNGITDSSNLYGAWIRLSLPAIKGGVKTVGINEENEEDDSEGQDEDLWDKDMETRDWGPLDISSRILRRQRTKTMQTDLKLGNSETEIWNSIQNNDDDDSGKFRNPFAIGIQEENDYLQQEKLGDESSESINYYGCGFVRRFEKCSTSENMPSASEDCRGVYHIVVTLIQ